MNSKHRQPAAQKAYERLAKRAQFLSLDWSLIGNLHDLKFQVEHEIDLYEEADHHATIRTATVLHRAKMLHADICFAITAELKRVSAA
jgi:hypothetical protein